MSSARSKLAARRTAGRGAENFSRAGRWRGGRRREVSPGGEPMLRFDAGENRRRHIESVGGHLPLVIKPSFLSADFDVRKSFLPGHMRNNRPEHVLRFL